MRVLLCCACSLVVLLSNWLRRSIMAAALTSVLVHIDVPLSARYENFYVGKFVWDLIPNESNSNMSYVVNEGNIAISFHDDIFIFEESVPLDSWSHICISPTDKAFHVFHDGHLCRLKDSDGYLIAEDYYPPRLLNVTIVDPDNLDNYCGYLAEIILYIQVLNKDDINSIRLGNIPEGIFNSYPLIIDRFIPDVNQNILFSFAYDELLYTKHNYSMLVFGSRCTYTDASDICNGYGGSLPKIENKEHEQMLAKLFYTEELPDDVWMENSYRSVFVDSYGQLCPMLSCTSKEDTILIFVWPCSKTSLYLICFIPEGTIFNLKGEPVSDDDRFVPSQTKPLHSITLESTKYLKGLWNGSKFQITNENDEVQFEITPQTEHLIGRQKWEKKNSHNPFNISLSVCGHGEFTCDNGHCIPIEKRCDAQNGDCSDHSDDDTSCKIFFGPPNTYNKLQSPTNARVSIEINIGYVLSIDMNEGNMKMLMTATLGWYDDRLIFYNLITSENPPNVLEKHYFKNLWYPFIRVNETNHEDNVKFLSYDTIQWTYIFPQRNGSIVSRDSYEALEYEGSNVLIKQQKVVEITVWCNFHLSAFPFDVQVCLIPIELFGNGHPEVNVDMIRVSGGNITLPVYRMLPIRCRLINNTMSMAQPILEVAILIIRRSEAVYLTMLGPCIVLEILGHISFLAFPIDEFNQRASTSISLLIVVATLFSQFVSTLPKSATPKAIDAWFFYFILRFFLFFVAHCMVELQRLRIKEKKNMEEVRNKHSSVKIDYNNLLKEPTNSAVNTANNQPQGKTVERLQMTVTENSWVSKRSASSETPIRPETINTACLIIGVAIDAVFIIVFIYVIKQIDSEIYGKFDEYDQC